MLQSCLMHYKDVVTGKKSEVSGQGGSINVIVSNSLITYYWSGADDTNAPTATALPDFTVGVSADGASTGLVYHVINGNWVDTGATVANLYGG